MKTRSFLGAIVFVAFCGIAASIIMFPYYEQVSLMIADDGQYQAALARFQKQLATGTDNLPTLVATVRLLQENGRDREAIKLAEKFQGNHPDDPQALAFLGQLYREAVRDDEFLEVVKERYRQAPSEELLRTMAGLCEELGHVRCEQEALDELIAHYQATPKDYQRLAYFYAAEGNMKKAAEVVLKLMQKVPLQKLQYREAAFAVRLLAYDRLGDEASQVAGAFIAVPRNKEDYFDILSIFADENMPKEGLAVFQLLPVDMRTSSRGYEIRMDFLMAAGDQKAAYNVLLQAVKEGKMTPHLFSHALPLTLDSAPSDFFLSLVRGTDLKAMQLEDLLDIATRAVYRHEPELAKLVQERLGQDYLNSYPVLLLALSLGAGDISEDQATHDYESMERRLSNSDNGILAVLYEMRGMDKLGTTALNNIKSLDDFSPADIFSLEVMLVAHKMEDRGIALLKPFKDGLAVPPFEVEASWMLLMAAKGEIDLVTEWVKNEKDITPVVLKGIFDAAYERRFGSLALVAAERLEHMLPSPLNRAYVASAQVLTGKQKEGLATLRKLFQQGEPVVDLYVGALIYLEKVHPEYATELTEVIKKEVIDPRVSQGELRTLGYMLLDEHLKQEAEPIFRKLAETQSFVTGDALALLDIWGEHLKPKEAEWVVEHASKAPLHEQLQWLHQLVASQQNQLVLRVLEHSVNAEVQVPEIEDIHFQALIALNDKAEAVKLIQEVAGEQPDLKRLKAWAKLASDAGYTDGAQTLYVRLMELDPRDPSYLRELGLMAFDQGDLITADEYLTTYLNLREGDYRVNYAYGEILWLRDCRGLAREFYLKAWEQVCALPKPTLSDRDLLAHTLARLECYCDAVGLYFDLIAENPYAMRLYADLGELFVFWEHYDAACAVIKEGLAMATCEGFPKDQSHFDGLALLQTVRLQLLKERGLTCEALHDAHELLCDHPGNADVLGALADIQLASGQWRAAMSTLGCALELQPYRTGFIEAREAISYDHRPYFRVNTEYRTSGTQHEWLSRLHGEDQFNYGVRLYLDAEVDHIHYSQFVPIQTGVETPFKGNRERGALGALTDFCSGESIESTVFFAEGIIGVGGKLNLPDPTGTTILAAAYREPCWDLIESTIQQGVRNHIGIARTQRFFPRFELAGSLTYNQYNLELDRKVATSYELLFGALYKLSSYDYIMKHFARKAQLSLAYNLEKEKVISQLTLISQQGAPFQPLGLSDRELHTGSLLVQNQFSDCWAIDGSFGYSYDHDAHHGGLMGTFGLTWGRKCGWQSRLYYYHVISSISSTQPVDSVLFEVRRPF